MLRGDCSQDYGGLPAQMPLGARQMTHTLGAAEVCDTEERWGLWSTQTGGGMA